MEYFDFIDETIIEQTNDNSQLNDMLNQLNIKNVYIIKKIKNKKDLEKQIDIPKLKNINCKPIYLFEDLEQINKIKNNIIMAQGNTPNDILKLVNNKNIDFIYNPIGKQLIFDEGCAKLAKINGKKIVFSINELLENPYVAIKQWNFIIKLLKKNKVDMIFISDAKNTNELIDMKIVSYFLLNFKLDENIINRFLNKTIIEK
ncbi:MAG TPA: hypothetical protein P5513_00385 [Candidatus Diapherotrites archaeon]|nr:hypothetical protein [Candidatus Diapherotrites archaeon]